MVKHINNIFGTLYRMLKNIRITLNYMDKIMMKAITKTIRTKLEYTEVAQKET